MELGLIMERKSYSLVKLLQKTPMQHSTSIIFPTTPNYIHIDDKIRIIESILLGFELTFYLQSDKDNVWSILTNAEIIQTIREFCNEDTFTLTNSKCFPELNDLVFSKWSGRNTNIFLNSPVRLEVMSPNVDAVAKQIFLDSLNLFDFKPISKIAQPVKTDFLAYDDLYPKETSK